MKVVHLIHGIDNFATGPTNSVLGMCTAQVECGAEVELYTLDSEVRSTTPGFVRRFSRSLAPKKLGVSSSMYGSLLATAKQDCGLVMHAHTLWTMQGYYPYVVKRKVPGSVYIVSPRGTFSNYSLSIGSRLKPLYWRVLQRRAVAAADCLHATSEEERVDIRRLGFRMPVAVIPNGLDVPSVIERPDEDCQTLTYLGRLHPEKGVEALLAAWRITSSHIPSWRLRIVGPDPIGYRRHLVNLARNWGLERVSFEAPVLGDAKRRLFLETEVLVLPSPSENFGMVVGEALSHGVPALATDGTPWSGLAERSAGWYCGTSAEAIAAAIRVATETSTTCRRQMGQNGRRWMSQSFETRETAAQMLSTYRWLQGRAPRPSFVSVD